MHNQLSSWFGSCMRIGLAEKGIAIARKQAAWRTKTVLLADRPLLENVVHEPHNLISQCAALLAKADCDGLPLFITIADTWARLFMVTPPHNAGRLEDLKAAAEMRFHALYGELPTTWKLQADWQVMTPFLACAFPYSLMTALEQIASDNHLHLLSVQPQFVSAWNRYARRLPADSWFGVIQDQSLTLGIVAQAPKRHLVAIRNIQISGDACETHWLFEQIKRAALQTNLPNPTQLLLVGNHTEVINTEQIDSVFTTHNLDWDMNGRYAANKRISTAAMLALSGDEL